jgi:tetratricopeptide (TPR) repeat protein
MKTIYALLPLAILAGCASPIQERQAQTYAAQARQAQAQNNWDGARRAYARAVVNAELAKLPVNQRAILTYEYGRSLGVTCFYDLAQEELTLAHELDRQAGNPLYLSLTELARLMFDQRKFAESIPYYEQAFSALDKVQAATTAPAEYVTLLTEYAQALTQAGRSADAKAAEQRSKMIKTANPSTQSITDRTPYGKYCTKKQ